MLDTNKMATIKYENLDIENVDVKEEVDSLENRHHDDVGETRLENIQGQDPLEPALSLELVAAQRDKEAAPLEFEETDGVSKKEVDAEIGKSLAVESVEKKCEKVFKEKENNTETSKELKGEKSLETEKTQKIGSAVVETGHVEGGEKKLSTAADATEDEHSNDELGASKDNTKIAHRKLETLENVKPERDEELIKEAIKTESAKETEDMTETKRGLEEPSTEAIASQELGDEAQEEEWQQRVKCLFWQTDEGSGLSCLIARSVQVELSSHYSAISSKLASDQKMKITTKEAGPDTVQLCAVFADEVDNMPTDGTMIEPVLICDDNYKLVLGVPDFIKLLVESKNAKKEETQIMIQESVQDLMGEARMMSEVGPTLRLGETTFGVYQLAAIRMALAYTEEKFRKQKNCSEEEEGLIEYTLKIVRKLVTLINKLVTEEDVWDKACQYPHIFDALVMLSLHQEKQKDEQGSFLGRGPKERNKT